MRAKPKPEKRVGVRELRQNLSVYLKRVKQGECLEITEHGRPVALLRPLPASATWLEAMITAGLATPAQGDLAELGPAPPLGPGERPLSQADWDDLREDRI